MLKIKDSPFESQVVFAARVAKTSRKATRVIQHFHGNGRIPGMWPHPDLVDLLQANRAKDDHAGSINLNLRKTVPAWKIARAVRERFSSGRTWKQMVMPHAMKNCGRTTEAFSGGYTSIFR